ncbi:hypothetical protein BJF78_28945 [Pseudonocardia sp. CNS-139]|nr:hypothetical protein BJF78_28945 [Pseudonocardia sp. CNS-139]
MASLLTLLVPAPAAGPASGLAALRAFVHGADAAGVAAVVVADPPHAPEGPPAGVESSSLLAAAGRGTSRVGLVATASAVHGEPYTRPASSRRSTT